jgi:hypothetical protein
MASLVLNGNTSGSVTISSPAVSGTTTLTLPSTSGTVVTTSGGVIPTSQLASGSATSSTYLRGDQTWSAISAGSLTLLGTLTTTSGNSLSLGSLDLTSYKYLYVVASAISSNTANAGAYLSASNSQTIGFIMFFSSNTAFVNYACVLWDLTSGISLQQAYGAYANTTTYDGSRTDITTATTTIYLRQSGTATFDAGSFLVYGGK